MTKSILLLSGGLDSTTLCALAKSEGREIFALTFDYHQRHRHEVEVAAEIAKKYLVREHLVFPLALDRFGGSSLTDHKLEVDKNKPSEQIGDTIPSTYVPARNTIFLSLAMAWAEVVGAEEIWIGINSVDYSGYPDCRPDFIESFEKMAALATKTGTQGETQLVVRTPLLHLSKSQIIELGISLGVDYSKTVTCYDPLSTGEPCTQCEACQLRAAGFREAGMVDPVLNTTDFTIGNPG